MPQPLTSCPCCFGASFSFSDVLWPELIDAWELNDDEATYINRQQGLRCDNCSSSLRSMTLAEATAGAMGWRLPLTKLVRQRRARKSAILEVNEAGQLTQFFNSLPMHQLVSFPDVDLQSLPHRDEMFDLVIHSDTLEHIPDPIQALRECWRVLKPGGVCAYTVPIVVARLSRRCDGRPESFHGSRDAALQYLVHTEYGADAWEEPMRAGFQNVQLFALEYPCSLALICRKQS